MSRGPNALLTRNRRERWGRFGNPQRRRSQNEGAQRSEAPGAGADFFPARNDALLQGRQGKSVPEPGLPSLTRRSGQELNRVSGLRDFEILWRERAWRMGLVTDVMDGFKTGYEGMFAVAR